jgi:hypothetical protein
MRPILVIVGEVLAEQAPKVAIHRNRTKRVFPGAAGPSVGSNGKRLRPGAQWEKGVRAQ